MRYHGRDLARRLFHVMVFNVARTAQPSDVKRPGIIGVVREYFRVFDLALLAEHRTPEGPILYRLGCDASAAHDDPSKGLPRHGVSIRNLIRKRQASQVAEKVTYLVSYSGDACWKRNRLRRLCGVRLGTYLAAGGESARAFAARAGVLHRTVLQVIHGEVRCNVATAAAIIRATRDRPTPDGGTVTLEDLIPTDHRGVA